MAWWRGKTKAKTYMNLDKNQREKLIKFLEEL